MYFSAARTAAYVDTLTSLLSASPSATAALLSRVDAFLIPDFVTLVPTLSRLSSFSASLSPAASPPSAPSSAPRILVGAQDCSAHDAGPFTGEVSPAVLRELGCALVEVGHAERRRLFGETDAVVRDKAAAVARNAMWPLVCVGEQERPAPSAPSGNGAGGGGDDDDDDEDGAKAQEAAAAEVLRQVRVVMDGLPDEADVVLAYEPVWAIGAPEPASAEHVRGVVRRIRESDVVRRRAGRTRIVYGGAAGPGLWRRLEGAVDGLFLGRFAHEPEQFVKMLYEVAGM